MKPDLEALKQKYARHEPLGDLPPAVRQDLHDLMEALTEVQRLMANPAEHLLATSNERDTAVAALAELRVHHAALEAEERRRTERILAFGEEAQRLLGGDLGDWRQVRMDGVLSAIRGQTKELTEAQRKLEAVSGFWSAAHEGMVKAQADTTYARAAMAEEAARTIDERVPYLRTCLGSLLKSDRESRMDYERQIARHEELAADIRALAPLPASVRCVKVETLERVKAAGKQLFACIEGGWAINGSPIGRAKWADAKGNLRAALTELEKQS